jgi:hypothetical protein
MSTDALIACPDPNCKSQLRTVRTGLRTFSHADTTVVGLEGNSWVLEYRGGFRMMWLPMVQWFALLFTSHRVMPGKSQDRRG